MLVKLSYSKKKAFAKALSAVKDGVGSAFQLHGHEGPSPRTISSTDPTTNIKRYWDKTGGYLQNAMDNCRPEETSPPSRQKDLFELSDDAEIIVRNESEESRPV